MAVFSRSKADLLFTLSRKGLVERDQYSLLDVKLMAREVRGVGGRRISDVKRRRRMGGRRRERGGKWLAKAGLGGIGR